MDEIRYTKVLADTQRARLSREQLASWDEAVLRYENAAKYRAKIRKELHSQKLRAHSLALAPNNPNRVKNELELAALQLKLSEARQEELEAQNRYKALVSEYREIIGPEA